jgi:hypothetical protein
VPKNSKEIVQASDRLNIPLDRSGPVGSQRRLRVHQGVPVHDDFAALVLEEDDGKRG